MAKPRDLSIEILKQIRDEIVTSRTETNARLDQTNARLDQTNARLDQTNTRLGSVEDTLHELAEQQRFVVRHLSALTSRDRTLEKDVDELRVRVEALERKIGPS
jgi:chromosome segregation ATPase